jgi:hypothetical protein
MALSGHDDDLRRGPLSGVKRTSGSAAAMSANDPKRTSSSRLASRLKTATILCKWGIITPAERDQV